jgi:hypothetical protein
MIDLTPEQVNDFLSKAVLESQIGTAVKASVDRVLKELGDSYKNPFDSAIRTIVLKQIETEVLTKFRPTIEASVRKSLESHLTDEIVKKIISVVMEKMTSRWVD